MHARTLTHKHNLHIWSRIWAYWRLLKISLMHMKNIDNIYTNKLIFSVVSQGEGEREPEKGLLGRERDLKKGPKPTETKNDWFNNIKSWTLYRRVSSSSWRPNTFGNGWCEWPRLLSQNERAIQGALKSLGLNRLIRNKTVARTFI